MTLIFDLDVAQGLGRTMRRDSPHEDRFERKGMAFHQKLRAGFLKIAAAEPGRCRVIDASGEPNGTADAVWRHVAPLLN